MTIYNSSIDLHQHLSLIDWIIFFSAFVFCTALIFYGQYKKSQLKTVDTKAKQIEYLLMGRQLTLPLFIATLVATWYGGIFGVTQIAFEQGIYNLFTQGLFWYVIYIIFAFCLVKKIRSFNALSLPEIVKKIYGHKAAKLAAVFVFIKTLPVAYAISIGLFLQCLFPISLFEATCLGVGVIVVYALSGGLRSIVYSDIALFSITCLGILSVILFSIFEFGGIAFLQAKLPASYFAPCGTHSLSTTLVWFFIACTTTFISPAFYQRCLAAIDDKVAIKGILVSTGIWFVFDLCTTFGAMYAKAVIPEADSVNAYLIYGMQILPTGFKGLLLASMAAAIIATLDSFLFIASNVLFYDLQIIKSTNLKLQHTLTLLITASLTILLSVYFKGRIEDAWLLLKSYFAACLLLPILFGYLFPRLVEDGLFVTNSIISCLSITIWHVFFLPQNQEIESFYIGCMATITVYGVYCLNMALREILKTFEDQ